MKEVGKKELDEYVMKIIKNNCKKMINDLHELQNALKNVAVVLHNNYYDPEHVRNCITELDKEIVKLNSFSIEVKKEE